MTRAASPPTIGLLSDSVIRDDPRLRRQGDILAAAGFTVLAVGLPGGQSPPPAWPIHSIDEAIVARANDIRDGARIMRRLRRLLDIPQLMLRPDHAFDIYWRLTPRFAALRDLAAQQRVDLWIANDWPALPIALQLQRSTGVPFGYDTHELAVDEYSQNPGWRLTQRPLIASVECAGIGHSAFVTCVSDGIADRLQQFHQLEQRPSVIRNTPGYEAAPFRPTGSPIGVLYHGLIAPGRALEECIASVELWRPEFNLTIRGPGEQSYLAALAQRVEASPARDRITIAAPVAMTQLVEQARSFDIGLFVIKGHSRQNRYVLPNKFFEYTMAGLALCVSDLPEMRHLVDKHDLGTSIEMITPEAIAKSINTLDRNKIDAFKTNALAAARELCWEHEGQAFVKLARKALSRRKSKQGPHRAS